MSEASVAGRYELTRRLAASRVTEVYLARDAGAQLERLVVVKRMLPHLLRDKKLVESFLSEARVASGLDHSNLVRVERIANEEAQCYYAMEYVRGVDLRRLLNVLEKSSSTMSFECAIAIGIELCAALGRVHEHTAPDGRVLVHRDVAPPNVLLSATGEVKLTDFGRQVPPKPARERTFAGTVRKRLDIFDGTIGYMSPEQCLGEPLDGRSDIYSLGVMLYEMTTGMRLCDPGENDFQIMERTVRGWVTPPFRHRPDYPEELQTIVMRAIERDPGRRYQTIGAMQRALEALQPAPASAIAELVAMATPRASSASELAPVPSLEDRPTVVVQRNGSSPKLVPPPKTRVRAQTRSRWLKPPWPYVVLGAAMGAGIFVAIVTVTAGGGSASAAAAPAALTAPSAPPALPTMEVIVPNAARAAEVVPAPTPAPAPNRSDGAKAEVPIVLPPPLADETPVKSPPPGPAKPALKAPAKAPVRLKQGPVRMAPAPAKAAPPPVRAAPKAAPVPVKSPPPTAKPAAKGKVALKRARARVDIE
jgi:serine/threonine-protein kinase